jgi:hypothetical protein
LAGKVKRLLKGRNVAGWLSGYLVIIACFSPSLMMQPDERDFLDFLIQ